MHNTPASAMAGCLHKNVIIATAINEYAKTPSILFHACYVVRADITVESRARKSAKLPVIKASSMPTYIIVYMLRISGICQRLVGSNEVTNETAVPIAAARRPVQSVERIGTNNLFNGVSSIRAARAQYSRPAKRL